MQICGARGAIILTAMGQEGGAADRDGGGGGGEQFLTGI